MRTVAKEVPIADISTPKIQKIISDMRDALAGQDDGVAIAAPQIGQSLRIFLVSGKTLARATRKKTAAAGMPEPDMVFINPVISKLSKNKKMMSEGCLSVR